MQAHLPTSLEPHAHVDKREDQVDDGRDEESEDRLVASVLPVPTVVDEGPVVGCDADDSEGKIDDVEDDDGGFEADGVGIVVAPVVGGGG